MHSHHNIGTIDAWWQHDDKIILALGAVRVKVCLTVLIEYTKYIALYHIIYSRIYKIRCPDSWLFFNVYSVTFHWTYVLFSYYNVRTYKNSHFKEVIEVHSRGFGFGKLKSNIIIVYTYICSYWLKSIKALKWNNCTTNLNMVNN